jgi:hypothetical protein
MNLAQFHRMRTAVQTNASPGGAAAVERLERALEDALVESSLFATVEVGHTEDPDRLVIALCRFHTFYSGEEVAAVVERAWNERLRYAFWSAHTVRAEQDHVELEAASRAGVGEHYLTVHLVAQRAGIPQQPGPVD